MRSISAHQALLAVSDASDAAETRRMAGRLVSRAGLSDVEAGNVALVATELATNLLKHARHGVILAAAIERERSTAIELMALDRGPGIRNLAQAMTDGYSTAGSPGTGLGAIQRLSNDFDVYSLPDKGTAVLARLWSLREGVEREMDFGVVFLPKPGEEVSGDGWAIEHLADRTVCMVVDGLGHGPDAAAAAQAALLILQEYRGCEPVEIVERAHGALRSTRGAALAVATIEPAKKAVRFCGIGNIAARIADAAGVRHLVSLNGIVGYEVRKISEFSYPWSSESVLIMHSDGLLSRWDLAGYPALLRRHPALIAGVLYRDCTRGRDDVTILSVRENMARAA